jgi:ATP-binding cassette, subfamily C (CFTR/MRP), member 1
MGKAQADWIAASQDRVTAVSKTLGGIKWVKMSGLNDAAFEAIRKLRSRELIVSRRFRLLFGTSLAMRTFFPLLSF